jgi:hypothetical protein
LEVIEVDETAIRAGVRRHLARLEAPAVSFGDIDDRSSQAASPWMAGAQLVALVVIVGSALLLSNTWASAPTTGSQVVGLPHAPASGPLVICNGQLLVGTLKGDLSDPRHAWLVSGAGDRIDVAWPADFTARFNPNLEILDGQGAVVAQGGQALRLGGSMSVDGGVFNVCRGPD